MKNLTFLFLMSLLLGCSTSKRSIEDTAGEKSHYHIQMFERDQPSDSAVIVVQTFSDNLKNIKIQPFSAEVSGDITVQEKSKEDKITFALPSGNYSFEAYTLGYYPNKTPVFFVNSSDSIRINFYMQFEPIE